MREVYKQGKENEEQKYLSSMVGCVWSLWRYQSVGGEIWGSHGGYIKISVLWDAVPRRFGG